VLLVPALSAGMLQALHSADAGLRPSPAMLFVAFSRPDRLLRLVFLGGLMLTTAMAAVMAVVSGALTGLDAETMAKLEQGDVEALLMMNPELLERLMIALLMGLVVSGTLSFFAVPLIWFRNMPLRRAIWLGLTGMMRNWKPLLVLAFPGGARRARGRTVRTGAGVECDRAGRLPAADHCHAVCRGRLSTVAFCQPVRGLSGYIQAGSSTARVF